MKTENIIINKSFHFAIRIVKLYKYLCGDKKEYVLSKQLLRSGTSIGANVNEAQAGQSKKILVTGTAGFIGYHLAKKLLERGDEVVGIDNINDYYDVNLKYRKNK